MIPKTQLESLVKNNNPLNNEINSGNYGSVFNGGTLYLGKLDNKLIQMSHQHKHLKINKPDIILKELTKNNPRCSFFSNGIDCIKTILEAYIQQKDSIADERNCLIVSDLDSTLGYSAGKPTDKLAVRVVNLGINNDGKELIDIHGYPIGDEEFNKHFNRFNST